MNFARRGWGWLAASLLAGQLSAQTATNLPAASPVELFRKLLAMPPAEQKEFLAARSPDAQRRILAKLREYDSLNPDQRELQLRVTELRWYLFPLLTAPATNRSAQLAAILERVLGGRIRLSGRLTPGRDFPPGSGWGTC